MINEENLGIIMGRSYQPKKLRLLYESSFQVVSLPCPKQMKRRLVFCLALARSGTHFYLVLLMDAYFNTTPSPSLNQPSLYVTVCTQVAS